MHTYQVSTPSNNIATGSNEHLASDVKSLAECNILG